MIFCANCGSKVDVGARFCPSCGKDASGVPAVPAVSAAQQPVFSQAQTPLADEKYCFSCGSAIKKIAEICPKCGVKQGIVPITANKPTVVFNVLTMFFASIGLLISILGFIFLVFEDAIESIAIGSVMSSGIILLGIIFALISLYRKQSKLFFSFCITLCAILVLWNILIFIIVQINYG